MSDQKTAREDIRRAADLRRKATRADSEDRAERLRRRAADLERRARSKQVDK